jgi:hypothetical protein
VEGGCSDIFLGTRIANFTVNLRAVRDSNRGSRDGGAGHRWVLFVVGCFASGTACLLHATTHGSSVAIYFEVNTEYYPAEYEQ